MAFPLTPVLDDFNTGALQNLSARSGWSATELYNGISFTTDAVPTYATGAAATFSGNHWDAIQPADQEVWVSFAAGATPSNFFLRARHAWATGNGYVMYYDAASSGINIALEAGYGVGAPFATATFTLAAGDSIGVVCNGSTILAWVNGAQVCAAIETTYTGSGTIGVQNNNVAQVRFDSFGGGSLALPRRIGSWSTKASG